MPKSGFKFRKAETEKFFRNFTREVNALKGRTHKGMINAIIVLQRAAEPGTPIDTGNLRASWFAVSYKGGGNLVPSPRGESFEGPQAADMQSHHSAVITAFENLARAEATDATPVLIFGYSANYAAFVHELVGVNWKRKTKEGVVLAKERWLYKAIQDKKAEILEEIRKHARIK